MSDFDPQQQATGIPEQISQKKQKKKGNKLTRNSSHPVCVVITLLFTVWPLIFSIIQIIPGIKIPVVAAYIVLPIGTGIQFYHNKNFAGRYLGKLRWHMYSVDGKGYYYFEALEKDNQTKCDSFTFWFSLWFIVVYNLVATIAYIFTVTTNLWSIPLTILGFVCGMVNLISYIRCSRDFRIKTKKLAKNLGQKLVERSVEQYPPQQV